MIFCLPLSSVIFFVASGASKPISLPRRAHKLAGQQYQFLRIVFRYLDRFQFHISTWFKSSDSYALTIRIAAIKKATRR